MVAALLLALGANVEAATPLLGKLRSAPILSNVGEPVSTPCWDVVQDDDGVLYFASTSLLMFDGERWESHPLPNAFAIRRLHRGPDGRIWIAATTDIGYFERDAHAGWRFHSLRDRLPPEHGRLSEAWGVSADGAGATFVTEDSILRWDGAAFQIWRKDPPRRLAAMHADGRFFVHVLNEGIYEVDANGPRLLIRRDELPEALVVWMEPTTTGWRLGTGAGFFTWDANGLQPEMPELTHFFVQHRLTDAVRLPNGYLAAATYGAGVVLIAPDGRLATHVDVSAGLPSNYAISLLAGRGGEVWITTGGGVVQLDLDLRSTLFSETSGLPQRAYRRIAPLGPDRVVVASDMALFTLDAATQSFKEVPEIAGRWHQLRNTSSGLLLAGLRELRRWQDGRVTTLHRSAFDVFAIAESPFRPGEILIGDNRSVLSLADGRAPRVLVESLPDNVTSLAEDPAGQLWIGTFSSGVMTATPNPHAAVVAGRPEPSFGLPEIKGITHVRMTPRGGVVLFANGGAWTRRPGEGVFVRVTEFPERPLAAVAEFSGDGAIWVAHAGSAKAAAGVGRIRIGEDAVIWEPHSIPALPQAGSPRSLMADVGVEGAVTLWIGGTRAVLRHTLEGAPDAPVPAPPLLRATATDAAGNRAPVTDALPFSTRQVEFFFAAPEHRRRALLRIETRIDGVDTDWVRVDDGAARILTALRDGRYTLRSRVVAETGRISAERTFTFEVLPPWWWTLPSLAAFGALTAAGCFGIYRLRVRHLHRRNAVLEARVRARTEELERANAAKTEFVANMSHDIRNPLNGIVGLAVALENSRLDAKQREMVATLRECTTYLSSLVDDVLDFAAIEAGKVELKAGPLSPGELLKSVAMTMEPDAGANGAEIVVDLDPDLPPSILGDAGRIQQIVVNFVSNAVKYAGGTIRLSASRPASATSEIEFAVTDSGPGISPEDQARLFAKFSRLRREQESGVSGTGLGLAACRALADIMGGAVGVLSAPGAGSRFFLRLPLIVVADEPAHVAALPNSTVLLVEDADYNAWAATAVLAKLGLTCERARNGTEALRLFAEKRFNVVLLDRNLPDMDGLEVARRMRAQEADESPALILAVTAYCTAEERARCLEAGMDAFVGKPLTPEKLRRVLLAAGRRMLAAATAEIPVATEGALNMSLLAYLSDGSTEGLEEQVGRYIAALDEEMVVVESAAAGNNLPLLATHAHRLHGHARMIGAAALDAATTDLYRHAQHADREAALTALERVRAELRSLKAAMRRPQPEPTSA